MNTQQIINHLRNRDYMSGVEREKSRVKSTGEVFTPTALVQEILYKLPLEQFSDPDKTFLDPTCGDGQFLSEVIIRKVENGSTYEQALATTYGVDLMEDNCLECIRRLYGAFNTPEINPLRGDDIPKEYRSEGLDAVFEVNGTICNIVCADGLLYNYRFGKPPEPEVIVAPDGKEVTSPFTFY
jgi:hypothetical protein